MEKKTVIKQTIGFGTATFVSRILGFARDILLINYLGAGIISDAFMTAYRLPNSLRKIFAEGAMSSSLTPTLVHTHRTSTRSAINSLMLLSLLIFEGALVVICGLTIWKAEAIIYFLAPGFSAEKIAFTIPFFRILMPLILFISTSALFASALQSVNHFFIPAVAQVLFNVIFIGSIALCLYNQWNPELFCYFVLAAGLAQFVLHLIWYIRLNFAFAKINSATWNQFKSVGFKFFFCFISTGLSEIYILVDTVFCSYLKDGSVTLMHTATRFMGLPMGIFATALATIMLPYVSRISSYAPRRLSFYLLEITKLVFWVTIPVTILMAFFSEKMFHTIFSKFSVNQSLEAGMILTAFSIGIFALSLRKMLLNIYYSLHVTWLPAILSVIATMTNIGLNFVLMKYWQATGLAIASTIAGFIEMILLLIFLYYYFGFGMNFGRLVKFIGRYCLQLLLVFAPLYFIYQSMTNILNHASPGISTFFLYKIGFWIWVGPLCLIAAGAIYFTRKKFKLDLYFLD